MKKIVTLLVTLLLIPCLLFMQPVEAKAASVEEFGGLEVSIQTDKNVYAHNEEVEILISVKNTNEFNIEGVSVETFIPSGLKIKTGEPKETGIQIPGNGTYESVLVVKEIDRYIPQYNGNNPGYTAPDKTEGKDPEETNPNTGGDYGAAFGVILLVALGGICIFTVKNLKKATKIISLLLCVIMAFGVLPMETLAEELDTSSVTVDKNIFIGGTRYTIETVVSAKQDTGADGHRVSFDLNYEGAVNDIPDQIVADGEFALEPTEPIRNGYTFNGWYSDSLGNNKYDFTSPVTANITLYANWSESDGKVTGSDSSVDVFSIVELNINSENRTAAATVSAPENCALVIRFIEEDVYFSEEYPQNKEYIFENDLYASHIVRAGTDMEQVIAEINGNLPDYYVAEAVLMDGNGNLLCEPFSSIEHTRRYEEFKQKTVYDFEDGETVLKFDEAIDNNFGVLADDVRIINVQDLVIDEETDIHYLTGVAETIVAGDKLFISDGADYALIRAKEVAETSDGIELLPANAEDEEYGFALEDFYKFMKVGMDYDGEMETSEDPDNAESTEIAESIEIAENIESSPAAMAVEVVDINNSVETSLSINPIIFETTHFQASGKIGGKISAKIVLEWDFVLFGKDYMRCDFTYSTNLNGNIKVVGKWGTENNEELKEQLKNLKEERELKLGKVRIPFGVTGLDAFAEIKFLIEWELNAGLEMDYTVKTTHGFKYNTKDGAQKIDKKEIEWSVECEGHAEIKVGPRPSVGVEFLNGVVSCEIECFFGAKAEADAVVPVFQGGASKHSCYLCIDGNTKAAISVDAKLKYKITKNFKDTPIDWNIVTVEKPLFDFYISLLNDSNSMFGGHVHAGKGSCPNEAFKTEFFVYDENGDLYNAYVGVAKKAEGITVASVASGNHEYLHEGIYIASAQIGSGTISRTFTVTDEAQTINLTPDTCDGSISGVVKNAKDQIGIENATVAIYKGSTLCGAQRTKSDGSYKISLAEGSYKYVITAENYVSASGYFTINDGETKYMEATLMAKDDDETIMGGVYGVIRDAQTGLPLSGVKVRIYSGTNNTTGTSAATDIVDTTNSNGEYSYKKWSVFGTTFGLPAGNYTAVLSKDGYITTSFNIVVIAGENTEFNGSISPVTAENEYRVVLTWGETPYDLDSHYVATLSNGNVEHVYYGDMSKTSATLDVDDTSSFGPETVYVKGFSSLENGFTYCVHDYSNRSETSSYALSNSGAKVQLYRGATLIATYYVPAGRGGTVWNVFSISKNGTVTPINTMSYEDEPYLVGMDFVSVASAQSIALSYLMGQKSAAKLKND